MGATPSRQAPPTEPVNIMPLFPRLLTFDASGYIMGTSHFAELSNQPNTPLVIRRFNNATRTVPVTESQRETIFQLAEALPWNPPDDYVPPAGRDIGDANFWYGTDLWLPAECAPLLSYAFLELAPQLAESPGGLIPPLAVSVGQVFEIPYSTAAHRREEIVLPEGLELVADLRMQNTMAQVPGAAIDHVLRLRATRAGSFILPVMLHSMAETGPGQVIRRIGVVAN